MNAPGGWNEYDFLNPKTWPTDGEKCEALIERPVRIRKKSEGLIYETVTVVAQFKHVDCGFSIGGYFDLPKYEGIVLKCQFPRGHWHYTVHNEQKVIGWKPIIELV